MVSFPILVSSVSFLTSQNASFQQHSNQELHPVGTAFLTPRLITTSLAAVTMGESPSSSQAMAKSITSEKLMAMSGDMQKRTQDMEKRAKAGEPLTGDELDDVIESLQYLTPKEASTEMDWEELRKVLQDIAHISHKDWAVTTQNSQKLLPFLIPDEKDGFPGPLSQSRYSRILTEGNWDGAVEHASTVSSSAPWAVLVTGVNGIRKTTSLYQPWFDSVLEEALVQPASGDDKKEEEIAKKDLPTGKNSFFRQLDHMIATLCNKDFATLYSMALKQLEASENPEEPSSEIIQAYSNLKAAIFTRYRTLSELFGVLLLQQAQKKPINCLMETSGRDVAMFNYVDFVFPATYRKLALHFKINDLSHAQSSVDRRMVHEIQSGTQLIQPDSDKKGSSIDIGKIIKANEGGPYGSEGKIL